MRNRNSYRLVAILLTTISGAVVQDVKSGKLGIVPIPDGFQIQRISDNGLNFTLPVHIGDIKRLLNIEHSKEEEPS